MRYKTPADGATAERQAWMRHTRRVINDCPSIADKLMLKEWFLDWGKARAARCQAKPGGLGRKPKT